MSRTYRTVNRFFAILNLLEHAPHGLTVRDVHGRLSGDYVADERTYRRDLENLEYLGFLISDGIDRDGAKAIRFKAARNLHVGRTLTLEFRELFALYVGRNMLRPLQDTPFYDDLEKVFTKIERVLGPKCQEHLTALASEIHFEPGPRWGLGIDPEILDVVERSCAEGHVLSMCYRSNGGETRPRRIGPHFLYFAKGSLYVVAEDLEDSKVKVFALPRMSKAEMTTEEYSGVPVNPENYFSSAWGVFTGPVEKVELVFYPPHALPVRERRWHSSQRIVPRSDGTVGMLLEVAVTPELIQWVLGFGDGVKVIQPPSLLKEVREAAKRVAKLYGSGSSRAA